MNIMKPKISGGQLAWGFVFLGVLAAQAYPPAPDGMVYGLVRDQYGNPLASPADHVVLTTANGAQVTAAIRPGLAIGVNFAMSVPMDTLLTPKTYVANAITAATPFKLYVVVNGVTNLPIEMTTATVQATPARQQRQDLTLGTDANGDGIPDAWEQVFLSEVGTNVPLARINVNADYARDGRTLKQEFVLGNYPNDPGNTFNVSLVSVNGGAAVLGFTTISGRSYTAYGSADLQNWTSLSFTIPAGTNGTVYSYYTATSVGTMQIQVIPPTNGPTLNFFRLESQ